MKAVIKLDVPDWQIGQEVTVHFPDTMCKTGVCEAEVKGELISRSELAHHKFLTSDNPDYSKWFDEKVIAYQKGWNDAIDAIIDNAPTITPEKALTNKLRGEENE